jgi:hypothetical protein
MLNFSQMSLTPTEKARWMTTNTMTLYLSHLAAFGLFMLASFQVSYNKMTIASYEQKRFMGLWLWCLTPLSTIVQLCRGSQLYWWRKPRYPVKTTDLSYKLYQEGETREYKDNGTLTFILLCDLLFGP